MRLSRRLDPRDRGLVAAIQDGLPLVPRPYAAVADRLGVDEREITAGIARLLRTGDIKRFGVVVRHRALGYRANAMVVWDVPDEEVGDVGLRLGRCRSVTLCYRRPRRPPDWPYNLFCMMHGRDRTAVLARLAEVVERLGLAGYPRRVLFSRRCFKQRGARYVHDAEPLAAAATDG